MKVIIHAGAAFTDEGLLLKSLQANKATLSKYGSVALGPRRYRRLFKSALDKLETESPSEEFPKGLKQVLPDDPNVSRVILSSDGFIGELQSAIQDGQVYPLAGHRMAYMDRLFADEQVELFLGLLNPGIFIPKVLMSLPEHQRQNILDSTDLSCLSWFSMIEDICDLAPGVRMTLWSNEDTPLIWGDILRAIGELPDYEPLQGEYELFSSLLTENGKREVLALIRQDNTQDKQSLHESLDRIFEDHAQSGKIEEELDLPGWNNDIIDAFSELYEQDLAQIQSMPGVRFLKP